MQKAEVDRWILCNDRPPVIGEFVALLLECCYTCIGYRENDSISEMTYYLAERNCRIRSKHVFAWRRDEK